MGLIPIGESVGERGGTLVLFLSRMDRRMLVNMTEACHEETRAWEEKRTGGCTKFSVGPTTGTVNP